MKVAFLQAVGVVVWQHTTTLNAWPGNCSANLENYKQTTASGRAVQRLRACRAEVRPPPPLR